MRTQGYLADTIAATETYGQVCTTPPSYPGDGVGQTRTYYDQPGSASPSLTVRPWRGEVTRIDQVKDFTAATPNWMKTSEATFDAWGRPLTVTDGLGNTTSTAYAQTNGLVASTTVTDPLAHTTSTALAVGRGLPVTVTDPNNKVTTGQYDALGRTLKVWKPDQPTSGPPGVQYAYTLPGGTTPPSVSTQTLSPAGTQITSYEIYDGRLRLRQTQTPTADGNRTITDTQYDQRGLQAKTSALLGSGAPTATLAAVTDTAATTQHQYTYDGLARQTADKLYTAGTFQYTIAATSYGGDRTTVDTPAGGTDTTTLVDFLGRTSELWQYQGSTPTGNHTVTRYGYDHAGRLGSVTGPDGAVWSYTYDQLGRKTTTVDPDTGTTTTTYDPAGHVTSTEDNRHQVLVYRYDALGRRKAVFNGSESAANQLAGWDYDSVAIGQLTSATRYIGGNQTGGTAYTRQITSYDNGYRPLHTDLTIPAAEGALAGSYGTDYTYKPNGAVATQTTTSKSGAAVGGLPAETLTYTYNSIGQPTGLTGAQTYLADTAYTFDGQTAQQILGTAGKQVRHTYGYETATRRLSTSQVDTENQTTPGTWDTDRSVATYNYDPAGNVQYIAGRTNGVTDQVECFDYDFLRRLTDAWTEAAIGCTTKQSAGADPYRLAWTFDAPSGDPLKSAGLRASETAYNTDGTVASQSTYAYGGTGKPKHSLATVTTTGAGAGTKTYDYDPAGNTTSRPSPGGAQQTLSWDAEGHLATVTDSAQTSMVYDADGNRIIRHDPGGYSTLTLTDGTELRANGSGSVAGTRYYAGLATRTANVDGSGNLTGGTTLTWTIGDHHGTGTIAINPTTLQVDNRRSLPYGQPRGTQPTGFGTKGFVGGTSDPTGLTHLGAREYDPTTGHFTSIDPIFDTTDPQSWNGYTYSNNAPVTSSDPSGTQFCDDCVDGGGRDTPGKGGGSSSVGSGGGSGSSCDRGEHSGCALDGSISGVEGGENSLDPRRPSRGNPPAGSQPCPPGNAPHKCHSVFDMFNMLARVFQ